MVSGLPVPKNGLHWGGIHSFRGINPLRGGDSCWNWISFWGTILLHNFETNWETHTSILLHPLNTGEKTSGFQMNPLICLLVWRCGIMKGFCFFPTNASGCGNSWEISETKRYKWHTHQRWKHPYTNELFKLPIPRLELFQISHGQCMSDLRHRKKNGAVWPVTIPTYTSWSSGCNAVPFTPSKKTSRCCKLDLRQAFSGGIFINDCDETTVCYKMFKYKSTTILSTKHHDCVCPSSTQVKGKVQDINCCSSYIIEVENGSLQDFHFPLLWLKE